MSDLSRHIDCLAEASVLVVGDVMLDRYIYGSVDRVSPEAPIPVLRMQREQTMLGGAGNVAANVMALGSRCRFVSVVGEDAAGLEIARLVQAQTGDGVGMISEPGRQTTVKTRFIASQQQLLRADAETVKPISVQDELLLAVTTAMATSRAVILSDYGKGVLTPDLTIELIAVARERGLPVVVDPKGDDYRCYRGASVVTPNRKELMQASGMAADSDGEVEAACRYLIQTCGVDAIVATRSERGMSVVTRDGLVRHLPAQAREVFDVSGAGDTVVATLSAALSVGIDLTAAAQLANLAGGIVVGKVGTAVVREHELRSALHEQEWRVGESKVATVAEAQEWGERWRRNGKRIGFTNGCFDLLHPGHVSLLNQARAACDLLVVGLNSDASVKRLKGETRPVQNETARATVLASLAMVDRVVIFGEDTPEALIHALRPDVLVKGADYTIETVVGAAFVQSYGGKVVLADLVEGQSTTNTIKRLKS